MREPSVKERSCVGHSAHIVNNNELGETTRLIAHLPREPVHRTLVHGSKVFNEIDEVIRRAQSEAFEQLVGCLAFREG